MQKLTMLILFLLCMFTLILGFGILTVHGNVILKTILFLICTGSSLFGLLLVYAIWRDER